MNKNKLLYEAPAAETFVVRFEGCLCTSLDYNANGTQKGRSVTSSWDIDSWDDEI